MDRRTLPHDVAEQLKRMAADGLATRDIASQLGRHPGTILYHLRRLGLARRPKRIEWPVDDMRRWYEEDGLTIQQIADRLGQKQKVVNKVAKKHGFRMRRRGPASGDQHPGWKGWRTVDKAGYILVYQPDHPDASAAGYVREHRLVAEAVSGRRLLRSEVVHHLDNNPQNNDPSNLQVFDTNGRHLAETLAGHCPEWTPQGRERIRLGVEKSARVRRAKSTARRSSTVDAQPSR